MTMCIQTPSPPSPFGHLAPETIARILRMHKVGHPPAVIRMYTEADLDTIKAVIASSHD